MKKLFLLLICVICLNGMLFANGASEKNEGIFPTEAVTLIIPYKAGGGMDTTARALAAVSKKHLGVPLVIINKTGGAGTIAASTAYNSKADGYTLFMVDIGAMGVTPVKQKVDYSIDGFDFISGINVNDIIIVTNSDSPYKTLSDLTSSTERIRYGTTGAGSILHGVATSFVEQSGISATNIPFGSTTDTVTAVLGGHIEIGIAHPNQARSGLADGSLRVLAVFSENRVKSLPEIPTMKEMGYDISVQVSNFLLAPKGVDPEKLTILRDAFVNMLNDPAVLDNAKNRNLLLWDAKGVEAEKTILANIEILQSIFSK
ncbi:MAG: tripartite tricarboxylate transporter substrate binding protein [Spirochaetaceae bacterium]